MGNDEYSDFDSLFFAMPNESYDRLISDYVTCTNTDISSIVSTPWTVQALTDQFIYSAAATKSPLVSKKKYKPVHRKHRPVPTYMPNPEVQYFREIPTPIPISLPLEPIDYHRLSFGSRVMLERLELMLEKIKPGILSKEEIDLLAFVVVQHESAFAFDYAEKGSFSQEYYPDYEIPTIEHVPWQSKLITIPAAIVDDVRREIISNEALGQFEPTTSSYRSSLFAVAKKPGSVLPVHLVMDLQELNSVTIQDSSLPPNLNEFAESFVGYALYGLYDLFSGFDACWIAKKSRPLLAFHSLAGARQQCTLSQGYTNAVQEFQRRVQHALKRLIEQQIADNFVDDCGVKGPTSRYNNEPIPGNPNIRRFVWEYIERLDMFLGALIMAGITASGTKAVLAVLNLRIVGTIVALEGWVLAPSVIQKVLDWPPPSSVSEVRSFLGLAGGERKWIKGFAMIAKPLTVLLQATDGPFIVTIDAIQAQDELKHCISSPPILIKVDYAQAKSILPLPRDTNEGLLVVAIDSSWMGAGWALYQVREGQKRIALYGSCTLMSLQALYTQNSRI